MAAPATLAALCGQHVHVELTNGTSFSSDLLAMHPTLPFAAFRQEPAHTFVKAEYRLVPVASIKSYKAVGAGRPVPAFKPISNEEIKRREGEAAEAARRKIATLGACACCRVRGAMLFAGTTPAGSDSLSRLPYELPRECIHEYVCVCVWCAGVGVTAEAQHVFDIINRQ